MFWMKGFGGGENNMKSKVENGEVKPSQDKTV